MLKIDRMAIKIKEQKVEKPYQGFGAVNKVGGIDVEKYFCKPFKSLGLQRGS